MDWTDTDLTVLVGPLSLVAIGVAVLLMRGIAHATARVQVARRRRLGRWRRGDEAPPYRFITPVDFAEEGSKFVGGSMFLGIGVIVFLVQHMALPPGPPYVLYEIAAVLSVAGLSWLAVAAMYYYIKRALDFCPECGRMVRYYRKERGLAVKCTKCKRSWCAGE